jgi:hypothetical protein
MSNILKIEQATGKKIGEVENYLRHYLTNDGRKLIEKEGNVMKLVSKPLRAKLDAATQRKIPGIIKEINQEIAQKHPEVQNFFEPDMFKLWGIRKAEHIKYINTHKFLEGTKARFGTRLDKAPAGRITEEGIKLVESSAPELKGWLLPQPIAKHIDESMQSLTNEESLNGLVGVYDKLLAFWKKNVTGVFPAFHTRNYIGGTFNNWLAYGDFGLKIGQRETAMIEDTADWVKIMKGGDDVIKTKPQLTDIWNKAPKKEEILGRKIKTKTGIEYSGQQLLDLSERMGIKGQPGMMDVYRSVNEAMDEITMSKAQRIGKAVNPVKSNLPRYAMEFVEDRIRGPLFLRGLKEGLSPEDAAKNVFKFHFDYAPMTGFTNFERNVMKRIIPFYTWTRNNIPLQLEMMMKQPGKYANLEKLRQSMFTEKQEVEFKELPEWMQESFAFPLPWKDEMGKTLWAQLDIPLEDINKLPLSTRAITDIASQLTPFLKYPMELYFNKNMYFGGDIWNPDLPSEMQTTKVAEGLKLLPSPIKMFLNFREVEYRDYSNKDEITFKKRYEVDAKRMHFLMTYLGRYFSTLSGVADEEIPPEWRVSRYVGGIPIRSFDIAEQKQWNEFEVEKQAQEIVKYLKQRNIIPYKSQGKKQNKIGF